MAQSFISEHSAELILVPAIDRVLSRAGMQVVPIYFWKTREGNHLSQKCTIEKNFRVIAMYARRPKVIEPEQDNIEVKINDILFQKAFHLKQYGIPTIAGVPRISTISDLRIGCDCSWFYLDPQKPEEEERVILVEIRTNQCRGNLSHGVQGPLHESDLLGIVNKAKIFSEWAEVISVLRGEPNTWISKISFLNSMFWPFIAYKPIYFLISEKMTELALPY
jgi:hypothetical protein